MVGAASQSATAGHAMATSDETNARRIDGSSPGTGDLMAEVVEVGGCPPGCPSFKERIVWAFL